MMHPDHQTEFREASRWFAVLLAGLLLVRILPAPDAARGLSGYAPLHTVMEVLAIAMASMVFGIVWTTQKYRPNGRTTVLGLGFLGVALLDMSHSLSYAGMPNFVTPSDPEKAINFWLAARSLAALALLWTAFWPGRWNGWLDRCPRPAALLGLLLLVGAVNYLFLLHPDQVPRTFLTGEGLTDFKIAFEYVLIALYGLAGVGFLRQLHQPQELGLVRLALASFTMAMSEFFFTLYANVTDVYNVSGHIYKIIAYGFLYRGLFVETVQAPYQHLLASEARLRATLDTLPDLLFELNREGVHLAVHIHEPAKLPIPAEDICGKRLEDILPPLAAAQCTAALAEAERNGVARGQRISLPLPSGEQHFELAVAKKVDPLRREDTYLVLARDITATVHNEQRIRFEARLNAALLDLQLHDTHEPEAAFLRRGAEHAARLTGSAVAAVHFPHEEQMGATLAAHYAAADGALLDSMGLWLQALHERQPVALNHLPHGPLHRLASLPVLEGGKVRMLLSVANKAQDYDGQDLPTLQTLAVAMWKHVLQTRQAQHIRELSDYDTLTGLLNKKAFDEQLALAIDRAQARRERLALVWFDLDNFKLVNDTLGHAVGDELLVQMANRLRGCLGPQAALARYSGDAFVAILPNADQASVAITARDALTQLYTTLSVHDHAVSVSASAGIAVYPDDADSAGALASAAEVAMYRVKQDGRNGLRFFAPEMQAHTQRSLELAAGLKDAAQNGELFLVYQPQRALDTEALVGAEALLRWRHPQWGLVSPAEFIPIAEQSGTIVAIDFWVLEQAARQLRQWDAAGLPPLLMSVNVSAAQFARPQLVEELLQILRRVGVSPQRIEVELTEAVALKNPELAEATIRRLHEVGFRVALDDFGTGYSSMSYLKRYALDKLKIDQSFVRELVDQASDQAIVTAIIKMAHSLHMTTIAEGVETAEQAALLEAFGCDEIQGYWYSRPLEPAAFAAFARSHALTESPSA